MLTMRLLFKLNESIIFHNWLPVEAADTINVFEINIRLAIKFIPENFPFSEKYHGTHFAVSILVEINAEISETLANHILNSDLFESILSDEYYQLANTLQKISTMRTNRLIEYARSFKRQFWLEDIEPEPNVRKNPGQFFRINKAVTEIDGNYFEFYPDRTVTIKVRMYPEPDYMLSIEDRPEICKFVLDRSSPPLIGSFLASARKLAALGNRRNALVEAVSALEVALSLFARSADPSKLERFRPGLEAHSFKALFTKLGMRRSFGIAIPLLFSESEFPFEQLRACRDAIEQRNNIVHNGARDVKPDQIWGMTKVIELSCDVFENYSGAIESK